MEEAILKRIAELDVEIAGFEDKANLDIARYVATLNERLAALQRLRNELRALLPAAIGSAS